MLCPTVLWSCNPRIEVGRVAYFGASPEILQYLLPMIHAFTVVNTSNRTFYLAGGGGWSRL